MTSGTMLRRPAISEILLIVLSVFLAVAAEGWWDEQGRAEDARAVLAQSLEELLADRSDLEEVRALQESRGTQYQDLQRWLSDYRTMPLDSVGAALDSIAWSSRTLWPRRAGWTTMVSGNQLSLLQAPELVASLASHHENLNARIRANGDNYGRAVNRLVLEATPKIWDAQNRVLLSDDPDEIATFRTEVYLVYYSWNQWYTEYLREYSTALDALIAVVQSFLDDET
jgi:uncharacterized protein DUF6090